MKRYSVIGDRAWVEGTSASESLDVLGYNDCTIYGGAGNDSAYVYGGDRERIHGGKGNDTVTIEDSNNSLIYGDVGNDLLYMNDSKGTKLYGGSGNDTLAAEGGRGTLYGGAGNDLIGVCGQSVVKGGAGNDSIVCYSSPCFSPYASSPGSPTVYGGAGKDTIYMVGNEVTLADMKAGEDTLVFGFGVAYGRKVGKDTSKVGSFVASRSGKNIVLVDEKSKVKLIFQGVNDIRKISNINVIKGQRNVEGRIKKAGTKTKLRKLIKNFTSLPKTVKTSGSNVILRQGFRGTFDLRKYLIAQKNVTAVGNKAKLSIKGNDAANILRAGSGGNALYGMGGNDILYGGKGNDNLQGGDGNDKLYAKRGNNTLYGGTGKDYLEGGSGTDIFRSGAGNDTIKCGNGIDKIEFYKGDGRDVIQGSDKKDILYLYNILDINTQVTFQMSGKNLVMNFSTNENDTITLTNWSASGINKFVVGGKTYGLQVSEGEVVVK